MSDNKTDIFEFLRLALDKEAGASDGIQDRRAQARSVVSNLSSQHISLLEHIVKGWSQAESAAELNLPMDAYERERREVFELLNARSTADAARIAINAGLE